MKTIGESMLETLKSQIVMHGVWDIEDAISNNSSIQVELEHVFNTNGMVEEDILCEVINEHYDFNEFGGFTSDYISNLMEVMMPMFVRMKFINEAQIEMIRIATERYNEKQVGA